MNLQQISAESPLSPGHAFLPRDCTGIEVRKFKKNTTKLMLMLMLINVFLRTVSLPVSTERGIQRVHACSSYSGKYTDVQALVSQIQNTC